MCGIVGFLGFNKTNTLHTQYLAKMSDAIIYRGPDSSGHWIDKDCEIALGHRRLAIVDTSPAGHQPMISVDERYILSFNGEIYNHLELRKLLENTSAIGSWRGHSDTETLLAGFSVWGIKETLKKSIGMFAIALWDRQNQTLTLARDRIGEKPLYYGWQASMGQKSFLFGSELKALRAHPAFENKIDRESICLQLRHNYIPAPFSIYQGVSKLEPGSILTVSLTNPDPSVIPYWSLEQVINSSVENPFEGSPDEAVTKLEEILKSSVRQQMIADVPLGAFLSGGVDSSTIVALMQTQSSIPIKTFTIGFNEAEFNEAKYAKAVANHLGTAHTELYVTPEQSMDVIPKMASIYDEPFSDSSQIPTFLVSKLARESVSVALSGDAGDELFCGYNRYKVTNDLWKYIEKIPSPILNLVSSGIQGVSINSWNNFAKLSRPILPKSLRYNNLGDKLHKGARALQSQSVGSLYDLLISHWHTPEEIVIGGIERNMNSIQNHLSSLDIDDIQRMMAYDTTTYLPDDILVKVDRASMAVSLESRVPFLDHRVVEFAWQLPQSLKLRDGKTKWIVRQVLDKYVPKELIERPKMGFGVPIGEWLRGPLRDWAESLLNEDRLQREGFFHGKPIRQKWNEHISGERNWQYLLWDILMFQSWLEEQ